MTGYAIIFKIRWPDGEEGWDLSLVCFPDANNEQEAIDGWLDSGAPDYGDGSEMVAVVRLDSKFGGYSLFGVEKEEVETEVEREPIFVTTTTYSVVKGALEASDL